MCSQDKHILGRRESAIFELGQAVSQKGPVIHMEVFTKQVKGSRMMETWAMGVSVDQVATVMEGIRISPKESEKVVYIPSCDVSVQQQFKKFGALTNLLNNT